MDERITALKELVNRTNKIRQEAVKLKHQLYEIQEDSKKIQFDNNESEDMVDLYLRLDDGIYQLIQDLKAFK